MGRYEALAKLLDALQGGGANDDDVRWLAEQVPELLRQKRLAQKASTNGYILGCGGEIVIVLPGGVVLPSEGSVRLL